MIYGFKSAREPVLYLEQPLIYKYGGHKTRFSLHPAMDRFRVKALRKIAEAKDVPLNKRNQARVEMKKRLEILILGARQRGNNEWLGEFTSALSQVSSQLESEASV